MMDPWKQQSSQRAMRARAEPAIAVALEEEAAQDPSGYLCQKDQRCRRTGERACRGWVDAAGWA